MVVNNQSSDAIIPMHRSSLVQADAHLVRLEGVDVVLGDVNSHLHPWSINLLPALDSPYVARADLESLRTALFGK